MRRRRRSNGGCRDGFATLTGVRCAWSLIELIVVIAIVGTLLALLLPAVQQVREAARASECRGHLRQITVATHSFEATTRFVPPMDLADGWATWAVCLMPHLEAQNLYGKWNLHRQYYVQPELAGADLPVLHCPSQRPPRKGEGDAKFYLAGALHIGPRGWSDFACVRGTHPSAEDGMFRRTIDLTTGRIATPPSNSPSDEYQRWTYAVSFSHLAVDGMANTLAFGEKYFSIATADPSVWNGDQNSAYARAVGPTMPLAIDPTTGSVHQFGSLHHGFCNFTLADGRVSAISTSVDIAILGSLAAIGDGSTTPDF